MNYKQFQSQCKVTGVAYVFEHDLFVQPLYFLCYCPLLSFLCVSVHVHMFQLAGIDKCTKDSYYYTKCTVYCRSKIF